MMGKTLESSEEIRRLVERYVALHQPSGYRLIVREPSFHEAGDYSRWVVPIDVDRDDVSAIDLANRLVDLEELIERETGKDIQLPPDVSSPRLDEEQNENPNAGADK